MMENIIVLAMKDKLPDGFSAVYIGRGRKGQHNPLGNPFSMKGEAQRDEVCEKHMQHTRDEWKKETSALKTEIKHLSKRLINGEKIALRCFCAPRRCHGDFLAKVINWHSSSLQSNGKISK